MRRWLAACPLLAACALLASCATSPRAPAPADEGWETLDLSRAMSLQEGTAPAPQADAPAHDADAEHLAKQLANPVANLISVPLQANYDSGIGPGHDGRRFQLNVQPVWPIELDADWNLISRTILPLIEQEDIAPGSGTQRGWGDVTQSLFLSPSKPTDGGLIWGAGPVFLIPSASDELLGAEQWGAGPTGLVLWQQGPWTYGMLANHIWSVAGDSDRDDIDATFLQPFLAHTTQAGLTYSLNTESTFDWKEEDWSVPINAFVTKVMKLGDQRVSIGGGVRYWAEAPDGGPEDFGVRLIVTLLYPKKR